MSEPIAPDEPGTTAGRHVYVLQFTSGVVKVGQTASPSARIPQHAQTAQAHGQGVARTWVSVRHMNWQANEQRLISFCAQRWESASGREYFAGADFAEVTAFAQSLTFTIPTRQDQENAEGLISSDREMRRTLLDREERASAELRHSWWELPQGERDEIAAMFGGGLLIPQRPADDAIGRNILEGGDR